MDAGWYHHSNGQTAGPLTLEELYDELGRSRDWRDEIVWHSSLGAWTYAGTIFQLTLHSSLKATPAGTSHADDQRSPSLVGRLLAAAGLSVVGVACAVVGRWLS